MYDKNWERYLTLTRTRDGEAVKNFLATLKKEDLIRIVMQNTYGYDYDSRN